MTGNQTDPKTTSSPQSAWGPRNPQWWPARILCLGLLALALAGCLALKKRPDVLQAQRLEIVTAEGKVCGTFGSTIKGNAEMALNDHQGRKRATFTLYDSGNPSMTLFDEDGSTRSSLDITPGGKSVLRMSGKNGFVRIAMEVGEDGNPVVRLTDDHGSNVTSFSVRNDGTPEFHIKNQEGRAIQAAKGAPQQPKNTFIPAPRPKEIVRAQEPAKIMSAPNPVIAPKSIVMRPSAMSAE